MTDKLRQAVETAIWNLEAIATSDWRRWEDSATPERFEAWVKHKADYAANALRQALEEPNTGIDRGAWSDVPSATKWVDELRGGDEKSENTQTQELSGKTEQLEAEIKRLQELADYRLKLLTKMPSEWVGLTDEEIAVLRRNGAHSVSDADFRAIEAKLKEKNNA